MQIYTVRGVTIEVAGGCRAATATRPEIKNDAGEVIQSGATAEFGVVDGGPSPEVQAQKWAIALPRIIGKPKKTGK